MFAVGIAVTLSGATLALPPPLCRRRTVQSKYDPQQDQSPSTRAVEEIKAAYAALCPSSNCGRGEILQNPTIGNNAVTWVSGIRDGPKTQVKIVYSANFLNGLNDNFGAGASFGILAHEVGHHLTAALGMRKHGESSWNEELRADYLAGCALGRSGRPSSELENALRALASRASKTHPSYRLRVPIVRRGYKECQAQAGDFARSRDAFGLGQLRRQYEPTEQCWGYWYRLKADMGRVGPVAAPRRRAMGHIDSAGCERARAERASERVSEACTCEDR